MDWKGGHTQMIHLISFFAAAVLSKVVQQRPLGTNPIKVGSLEQKHAYFIAKGRPYQEKNKGV